jgi:hypothetical protein
MVALKQNWVAQSVRSFEHRQLHYIIFSCILLGRSTTYTDDINKAAQTLLCEDSSFFSKCSPLSAKYILYLEMLRCFSIFQKKISCRPVDLQTTSFWKTYLQRGKCCTIAPKMLKGAEKGLRCWGFQTCTFPLGTYGLLRRSYMARLRSTVHGHRFQAKNQRNLTAYGHVRTVLFDLGSSSIGEVLISM